jgi:leucine-zipper of insertion element IS481
MAHANARLTEFGRLLLVQRITELGWPAAQAAESLGVSRVTAYKWLGRYRALGPAGLADRPSRPRRCPTPFPPPRSVGCWLPAGGAARGPIGSATTWHGPLHRLWGAAPPWPEPACPQRPGQWRGGAP